MKSILSIASFSLLLSLQSMAATFSSVKQFKSSALEALSKDASRTILNDKVTEIVAVSSSANEVLKYSFVKKSSEADENTIKQFNVKYLGIYQHDDMGATGDSINPKSSKDFIEALFSQTDLNQFEDDQVLVLKSVQKELSISFNKNVKDYSRTDLKFFKADHADEDGSWGVLNILDTKTNEILAIRFGYYGT